MGKLGAGGRSTGKVIGGNGLRTSGGQVENGSTNSVYFDSGSKIKLN